VAKIDDLLQKDQTDRPDDRRAAGSRHSSHSEFAVKGITNRRNPALPELTWSICIKPHTQILVQRHPRASTSLANSIRCPDHQTILFGLVALSQTARQLRTHKQEIWNYRGSLGRRGRGGERETNLRLKAMGLLVWRRTVPTAMASILSVLSLA
jgi:hypothetical protein